MKTRFTILILLIISVSVFGQNMPESHKKQIENYKTSAQKYAHEANKPQEAHFYNKIAFLYWQNGVNNEAIDYFQKSIALNKQIGNKHALKTIYQNIATIYSDLAQYDNCISYFEKSLEIIRTKKKKKEEANVLYNIAIALRMKGDYQSATKKLEKALNIALEVQEQKIIRKCYGELAENYAKLGDTEQTVKYSNLFATFDANIKAQEMAEVKMEAKIKVAQAQAEKRAKELLLENELMKHKLTKDSLKQEELASRNKELEIESLKRDEELKNEQIKAKEAELKTQTMRFWGAVVILIFVLCFSVLLYIQIQQKKKANKKLAEQNIILDKQKREIEAKNTQLTDANKLLAAQKREIEKQNAELTKVNNQINKSIEYAKNIQEAILPSKRAIKENFNHSFIFYRPQHIVSGDFYWFSKTEDYIFIAAVDCTGHSVPGAFMSMIGNTLLNEIINEKHILDPSEILKYLDEGVISMLHQDDDSATEDGMAITLCRINKPQREIHVACANHFAYLFNDEYNETIIGQDFAIGDTLMRPEKITFPSERFQYTPGTCLYMFSDGYQDQMGGTRKRKFMVKNMRKLLYENYKKPIDEQYDIVEKSFDHWQGTARQNDDVLVIGIMFD